MKKFDLTDAELRLLGLHYYRSNQDANTYHLAMIRLQLAHGQDADYLASKIARLYSGIEIAQKQEGE